MDLDELTEFLHGTDLGDPSNFRDVPGQGESLCPDWTEEALNELTFDPFTFFRSMIEPDPSLPDDEYFRRLDEHTAIDRYHSPDAGIWNANGTEMVANACSCKQLVYVHDPLPDDLPTGSLIPLRTVVVDETFYDRLEPKKGMCELGEYTFYVMKIEYESDLRAMLLPPPATTHRQSAH